MLRRRCLCWQKAAVSPRSGDMQTKWERCCCCTGISLLRCEVDPSQAQTSLLRVLHQDCSFFFCTPLLQVCGQGGTRLCFRWGRALLWTSTQPSLCSAPANVHTGQKHPGKPWERPSPESVHPACPSRPSASTTCPSCRVGCDQALVGMVRHLGPKTQNTDRSAGGATTTS